ncbi:MAG: HlyD family secretion protein [Lachnospiraceae bacterium]|jgi:HlyD family secretion protein|nr:HlyD family secretion protein [Lachnospiraceae bacterium]
MEERLHGGAAGSSQAGAGADDIEIEDILSGDSSGNTGHAAVQSSGTSGAAGTPGSYGTSAARTRSSMTSLTGKQKHPVRRRVILILVIAAAVAAAFFLWRWIKSRNRTAEPVTPTAYVEQTDIEKVFNASGTVISAEESAQNANAASGSTSGYVVQNVNVKVGDSVKKGDVLYTIDMSETEAELALNQQKLANTQAQNSLAQAQADRAYRSEQQNSVQQVQDDTNTLQEAADDTNQAIETELHDAKASVDTLQAQTDSLQAQLDAMKNDSTGKKNAADAADYNYTVAQAQFNRDYPAYVAPSAATATSTAATTAATANSDADQRYQDLQDLLLAKTDADAAYSKSSSAVSLLTDQLTQSQTDLKAAQDAVDAVTTKYRALEKTGSTVNSNARTQWNTEQDKANAAAKQQLENSASTLETQTDIQKAKDKLQYDTVYASMDGTVTAVNVVSGQLYSGSNAVVIDNVEKMNVTANIDEAHIADITTGMRVRIKTSATSDEELGGVVTFASPTPVTTADSSSSGTSTQNSSASATGTKKPTYRVDIELDEANPRLRIGMTANISFILARAEGCLAVPTADIMTTGDGQQYVTRIVSGDGSGAAVSGAAGEQGAADTSGSEGVADTTVGAADITSAAGASEMTEAGETGESIATGEVQDISSSEDVMITTGIADDYYTQILTGSLKNGDMIIDYASEGTDAGSGDAGSRSGSQNLLEGLF